MINELSKSADLLAKSERESAWREMAKQVAHEIKNPLTPMKLSIQHLQRTWNDNDSDKDKKIEQITKTIVEQIDSLSSIATAFSNFAQMPKTNLEHVDLIEIINSSIRLFNENERLEIVFNHPAFSSANVFVDKEQMLRVFNNLFKNAIQSIPENEEGKIMVELSSQNNSYLVAITDNGEGIDETIVNKIFNPNFTTKTGGMGLGLAMVKSIIESCNGKIWFETKKGLGTTFYVSLNIDTNY
jgi:nitrogen fixation/metabolism regulation signal transduction histidine kinase